MEVIVTDKARDYIKSKSSGDPAVTVEVLKIKTGWTHTFQLSVKIGNPNDKSRFNQFENNGVAVYLMEGMRIPDDKIEITLKNYIIAKSLSVKGAINYL